MLEIRQFNSETILQDGDHLQFLVCDESAIKCATLPSLLDRIKSANRRSVLALPAHQYQEGLRGNVKVQILSSVTNKLEGVYLLETETDLQVLEESGLQIIRFGKELYWKQEKSANEVVDASSIYNFELTNDINHLGMIERARSTITSSNCWLDPAGCVFTKNGEVVLESTSTSFNNSGCKSIPLCMQSLRLKTNERMLFCDSLHAERVGIVNAANEGISLKGSTIYVTKFPCRSCSMEIIGSGISTVVFDEGSYGLRDANLLIEKGVRILRIEN